VSGIPFVVDQSSRPSVRVRAEIVRALDAATALPVKDATVTVRLRRRSAMDEIIHKKGRTNAQGIFAFTFEEANGWAKASVSVDAPGYWGVDDESSLTDERIITLYRLDGERVNGREDARQLWMDAESCGQLLWRRF
jgi:hypothetical protein